MRATEVVPVILASAVDEDSYRTIMAPDGYQFEFSSHQLAEMNPNYREDRHVTCVDILGSVQYVLFLIPVPMDVTEYVTDLCFNAAVLKKYIGPCVRGYHRRHGIRQLKKIAFTFDYAQKSLFVTLMLMRIVLEEHAETLKRVSPLFHLEEPAIILPQNIVHAHGPDIASILCEERKKTGTTARTPEWMLKNRVLIA